MRDQHRKTSINPGSIFQTPAGNGSDYDGRLYTASFTGDEGSVRLSQDMSAAPNTQSGHYSNARHAASIGCHEAVMQLTLAESAKVDAWNENKETALHLGVREWAQERN